MVHFTAFLSSLIHCFAVAVNGTDAVANYRRNGTAGQSITKSFADAAAAQKHADKLIQEKTGKGYIEVRSGR